MHHLPRVAVTASIMTLASLSACGGGGGGSALLTAPSSTPSSAPTSSPTSAPAASPQASITSVTFQSGVAQTFTVIESGYTGTYTESDTCNPLTGQIAAVTTSSNANGAATIQVAPLSAGTCSITVSDASGRSANVSVSVATAAITVQ